MEIDLKWVQKRALDITPEMCRDMHRKLGRRGPVAANGIMQSFNTIWNYSRRMDRNLPESPAAGLEWLPEKKSLNTPIRDLVAWKGEVDKIETHVHRAAYMLALFTGLRRSEIEALEWDRVGDEIYLPSWMVASAHLLFDARQFYRSFRERANRSSLRCRKPR